MENARPGYYMVRAMKQTEPEFSVFFERNVVAVGWSHVDFSSFEDLEALVREVDRVYHSDGNMAPQVRGKKNNEVRRFKGLKSGDRMVVPYFNAIRLAEVGTEELYDPTIADSLDLSNQRRVRYVREGGSIVSVPRSHLSEGLQRRLRVRGATIADLLEFSEEIETFFHGKVSGGWSFRFESREREFVETFKHRLLQNLQEGKTNLQAGGTGLENLVRELLEAEGYQAQILPKRTFPGFADADIRASKADRFDEVVLLVQVKHHSGVTSAWGAEQLAEILRQRSGVYEPETLVLVTTGEASEELRQKCEEQDIVLFTGRELVDWIFDALRNLAPDTRIRLGISGVPGLVFH